MVVYIYIFYKHTFSRRMNRGIDVYILVTNWLAKEKKESWIFRVQQFVFGWSDDFWWMILSFTRCFFSSSSSSAIVYYLLFAGFLIYSFTLHVSHYYFLSITFVFYFHCFSAAASSSRSCSCSLVLFGSLCACKLLACLMLLSLSCSRFYVKNQTLTHTSKRGRKRTKTRNYEQFWQNIQFFLSFSLSFTASRLNREEYSVRFYFGEMILLFRKYSIETVRNVHSPGWKKVSFWIWL